MTVRTRFAPSPTGFLHLGSLRAALYAYLFARKNDGVFMLRIEDTDQNRYVEGATEMIYRTLREIGMSWDEGPDVGGEFGPYIQSERMALYLPYAEQLVREGKAYYCFCTKDELDERRAAVEAAGGTFKYDGKCSQIPYEEAIERVKSGEPYVIRQKMPKSGEASFDDLIYGHITAPCSELDDMVLIKADGMPTYNFANVIDDHTMQITHVMRGNEYLASTPKYNLLYEAFGWEKPVYIHMPQIMRDAHKKLSKRDGDANYEDFTQKGYLKEAIINYVALLGWNPGDEREFFTLPELVEAFSLEGLSKSPAIFDPEKLLWMNAEYIRRLSPEEFDKYARPWYESCGAGKFDPAILTRILQPRVEIFSQIPGMIDFLTDFDPDYPLELFTNKKSKTDPAVSLSVLDMALPALSALPEFTETAVHDTLLDLARDAGLKNGTMLWPVRIALAGKQVTPGGAIEIAVLLEKDESLRRLNIARQRLSM